MPTALSTGTGTATTGEAAALAAVREARAGHSDGAELPFVGAFVFSSATYEYQAVVDTVRSETGDVPLVGSSSAGEFTAEGPAFESVTVALLASDEMRVTVGLGEGLRSEISGAVERAAAELPDPDDEYPHRVGINLHDGLVGRGEEIAMLGYQQSPMPFVGGSAADDLELDETVVFANDSVASDAVALATIESQKPFGRAVGHGHSAIAGPYTVTEADGSVVTELDGRPAYEQWKDAVGDAVAEEYDLDVDELDPEEDAFETLLTRFEFGIHTGDEEYKIRWPGLTTTTDGPLTFATKIAPETELYVVDSSKEAQVETANVVSEASLDDLSTDVDPAGAIAFDCVCQAAILGDEFDRAVEEMATVFDVPFAGMQTYGEIALGGDDLRAYHNTTSSILVFPS